MKRWLVLLLTAVLCVAFSACGGAAGGGYDNSESNTENTEKTDLTNHPLLFYTYGKWTLTSQSNYAQGEMPCSKVQINEDGTCLVDGVAATWKIADISNNGFLRLDIFSGGKHTLCAGFYGNSMEFAVWEAEYWGGVDTNVWKREGGIPTDENDLVITPENWQQYFELVTVPEYRTNAFGDLETLVLVQSLQLKEAYASRVMAENLVVEVESTAQYRYITLSADGPSYTLGDVKEDTELEASITDLYCHDGIYKISIFGNNYVDFAENQDPDQSAHKTVILVPDIPQIRILRAQGAIWIAND